MTDPIVPEPVPVKTMLPGKTREVGLTVAMVLFAAIAILLFLLAFFNFLGNPFGDKSVPVPSPSPTVMVTVTPSPNPTAAQPTLKPNGPTSTTPGKTVIVPGPSKVVVVPGPVVTSKPGPQGPPGPAGPPAPVPTTPSSCLDLTKLLQPGCKLL